MARKNIKVSAETHARHNDRREYYGLTWEQYLDAGCPDIPDEK